jgi:hypothetical protein
VNNKSIKAKIEKKKQKYFFNIYSLEPCSHMLVVSTPGISHGASFSA